MSRRRGAGPYAPWDGDRGSSHRCGRRGPALVPSSGQRARGCGRRAAGGAGGPRECKGGRQRGPGRWGKVGESAAGESGGLKIPEVGGRAVESNQSRPRQSPNNAGSPPRRKSGSALESSLKQSPHLFRGGPPQQTARLPRPVSPLKGRHGFHWASRLGRSPRVFSQSQFPVPSPPSVSRGGGPEGVLPPTTTS